MTDIYDIKTIWIGFIYSFDYLLIILVIVFFVFFYIILNYLFNALNKVKVCNINVIKTDYKEVLDNIKKNIETLSREIFYREVGFLLRKAIFNIFKDKSVFFMTLQEIEQTYESKYNNIFKEVYFLEFNINLEDNLKTRIEILKKLENFLDRE